MLNSVNCESHMVQTQKWAERDISINLHFWWFQIWFVHLFILFVVSLVTEILVRAEIDLRTWCVIFVLDFLSTFLIVGPALTFCIKIMLVIKHNIKEGKNANPWYPVLIVAIVLTLSAVTFHATIDIWLYTKSWETVLFYAWWNSFFI